MKFTNELQELINEYRAAMDAADAAKALILEAFEAQGIKSASASFNSDGVEKITVATYRAASADSLTFDKSAFCNDPARAALYDAFVTKPRKGSAATVSFTRKTA